MRRRAWILSALAGIAPLAAPAAELSPAQQRDRQKELLSAVEQTARRVGTALRVVTYQKLDPAAEHRVLDEVAKNLRHLGDDQIQAILAHLEAAAKAPDEAVASAEQREAYVKHRQVVASLRGMLVKLDVLKSLDQAAQRLDRMAKRQFALRERAVVTDQIQANRTRKRVADEREELADGQGDLRAELTTLGQQLQSLRPALNPELRERLDASGAVEKTGAIAGEIKPILDALLSGGFRDAAPRQLRSAQEMQALATALRTPRDRAAQLREARDAVEKLREAQEQLKAESAKKPDPKERPQGDRAKQEPKVARSQEHALEQNRLEFRTREVRKALEQSAKEVADVLTPAEGEMQRAGEKLNNADAKAAQEPQAKAAERLAEARERLDQMLAAAEKQKSDPLAATQKAAEEVAKLIEQQEAAQAATQQNAAKPDQLKPAQQQQADIAKKAEALKAAPLPDAPAAEKALEQAAEAAKAAADALARPDAAAAEPKQAEARKALEEAKKALDERAAGIEKRREEIAELEAAAAKVAELANKENAVAEKARRAADAKPGEPAPKPADVAKEQAALQEPTEKLAQELQALSPDAAGRASDAAKSEEKAQDALGKNDAKKGAQEAMDAAKQLDAAKAALAQKSDALKAQEVADQAALKPDEVNASDAAKQVAKALDQAKKEGDHAEKAAVHLGQKPDASKPDPAGDLAKLQKEVAAKASEMQKPDAAASARKAAEALAKGDLADAAEEQAKAAGQLAEGDPKPAAASAGPPKPAESETPGELAEAQEQIRKATEALAAAAQANAAAQAALDQAQALAPEAVKAPLDAAAQKLQQAGRELAKGEPVPAQRSEMKAAEQLAQALQTLNAAAEAAGQPTAQPGQDQQASAVPNQPMPGGPPPDGQQAKADGDKPGQKPGDKQGQGKEPGKPGSPKPGEGEEKNDAAGEGDRADMKTNNRRAGRGAEAAGDGAFINLQKRERDKVQQAGDAAFPAEFRELIKQYNINIKTAPKAAPPGAK